MDVLIDRSPLRPRRSRALLALAALAPLLAGVAACFGGGPGAERGEPSFPHRVHVESEKLRCAFCHVDAGTRERPSTPPPELCAPCHDNVDRDKAPTRRLAAFYDGGSFRRLADAGIPGDVTFSHLGHIAGGLACDACHGDVAAQVEVPVAPLVQKQRCMDCHAATGASNDCRTCHRQLDRGTPPRSHARNWQQLHGAVARGPSAASQDRCDLCHTETTSCRTCHQLQPPRDHDNRFRLRSHGLAASFDRERCAVCHTRDSCAECHRETRPQSHRGGFGAPAQRHCTGCHLPVQDTGCRVCHPATPEHDLATPLPSDHNPAMNCRMCHGAGVRLPHPDGGHICTACHR